MQWVSVAIVASIMLMSGALFYQYSMSGGFSPGTLDWLTVTHAVTRAWLALGVLTSVGRMMLVYRRSSSLETRQKALWLLMGVIVSAVGFVGLWVLPVSLGYAPLLPESVVVLIAIVAPIAFTISIVRYRALDITVITNLSVVHAIVIAVAVAFYVSIWTLLVDQFDLAGSFSS